MATLSKAQAKALGFNWETPAENKYKARVTVGMDGRKYDSKAEAIRADEHFLRCKAEPGSWYIPQVRIDVHGIPWTCDFLCYGFHDGWGCFAEDVTGHTTQRKRDIIRLWRTGGGLPIPLHILRRAGKSWEREIIVPEAKR